MAVVKSRFPSSLTFSDHNSKINTLNKFDFAAKMTNVNLLSHLSTSTERMWGLESSQGGSPGKRRSAEILKSLSAPPLSKCSDPSLYKTS